MNKKNVKVYQAIIDESKDIFTPKTILTIKTRPNLKATKKGAELNDGYDFEVNGALPEIADGIAKFARELPKNGFGKGSDGYFITLINEYFKKL